MEYFRRRRVTKVLKRAGDLIETKGWVQHSFSNNQGFCAIGALREAALGHTNTPNRIDSDASVEALTLAEAVLKRCVDTEGRGIIGWNDRSGRTEDEVKEAFRCALEKVQKKEVKV